MEWGVGWELKLIINIDDQPVPVCTIYIQPPASTGEFWRHLPLTFYYISIFITSIQYSIQFRGLNWIINSLRMSKLSWIKLNWVQFKVNCLNYCGPCVEGTLDVRLVRTVRRSSLDASEALEDAWWSAERWASAEDEEVAIEGEGPQERVPGHLFKERMSVLDSVSSSL